RLLRGCSPDLFLLHRPPRSSCFYPGLRSQSWLRTRLRPRPRLWIRTVRLWPWLRVWTRRSRLHRLLQEVICTPDNARYILLWACTPRHLECSRRKGK
ncbi:unnamed protein product, partial [Ixodes pacificus]